MLPVKDLKEKMKFLYFPLFQIKLGSIRQHVTCPSKLGVLGDFIKKRLCAPWPTCAKFIDKQLMCQKKQVLPLKYRISQKKHETWKMRRILERTKKLFIASIISSQNFFLNQVKISCKYM